MSLLPPYVNKELFSEHFLSKRLPARPEWAAARDHSTQALATIRAIFAKEKKRLPKYSEEQLRKNWIDPILVAMGVHWDPEPALPTDDPSRTLYPDYVCFDDDAARSAAQLAGNTEGKRALFKTARFIGDAKSWEVSFLKPGADGRTPRQQLNDYIQISRVPWGFLTNGRRWRLTHTTLAGRSRLSSASSRRTS